jgi:CSLREA domain-containing protein
MRGLLLVILLVPVAGFASTIAVNTTADNVTAGDGQCTLREAIANVNAATDTTGGDCVAGSGSGDTIVFSLVPPARIRLAATLGELMIGKDVSIAGLGDGALYIDGQHRSRVFHIAAGMTTASDMTIQNGRALGSDEAGGGGILVDSGATLNLTNCALRASRALPLHVAIASSVGYGGGIRNRGTLTLTNCTLVHNLAGNGGGAIENEGQAVLNNCTLSRNSSGWRGGAIRSVGSIRLINCTLSRNHTRDSGGALTGTGDLTNCTLSGNRATYGYGGAVSGAGNLINCTLTGNRAVYGGSAIYGSFGLINCTVTANRCRLKGFIDVPCGGIQNDCPNCGAVTLTNTIVADNEGRGGVRNCSGSVISAGHNLSSDDTCFMTGGTDLLNTAPALAPLGDYGGPTSTLALCTAVGAPDPACTGASPAIDLGDDAVTGPPDNLTTDQRGLPRHAGAHVDIGAYEAQ